MDTLVHELSVDTEGGTAEVEVELLSISAKRRVLQVVGAPESAGWSCKVFVRLEYEALTDEVRSNNLMVGEATHDRQIDAFNGPTPRGG